MLKNKTSIFILLGVLIAIAIGLQFIGNEKKEINKVIKAVPKNAAIILETNNFSKLINKINKKNLIKNEFEDVAEWKGVFNKINFLDSIFANENNIKDIFTNNNIIVSLHGFGNTSNELLFLIPLNNSNNIHTIKKIVTKKMFNVGTIEQRTYENIGVFDVNFIKLEERTNNFHYYFTKNAFIFSFSKILLEKSVRKIQNRGSIADSKAFKTISATSGKNVDANIYINYKFFNKISSSIILPKLQSQFSFFKSFASWSAFDLKIKNDAIFLSGFTHTADSLNYYLSTFKNQAPIDNDFTEVLPKNTSAFITLNFSNINDWRKRYIKYLSKYGDYINYKKKQKQYKTNIKDLFYENIEGNVSIAWINKSISEGSNDAVGIFRLSNPQVFNEKMNSLIAKDSSANALISKKTIIDKENNISIKRFLLHRIFSKLFGSVFANLNSSFYFIVDDYAVFANSPEVLSSFYKNYKSKNNLKNDIDFQNYSKSISSESNIFVYSNLTYSKSIINSVLNKDANQIYNKNIKKINKLHAFTTQFSNSKELVFSSMYLNYNPLHKRSNKYIWEINLNNTLKTKPQIFVNHNTWNNEIVLQDENNTLYLINETGKILWKKKLNEKILGKINQVDFYKNNKLQLMFNTKSKIYLIDRNGKNVENYPIQFKSPATNPIAIFDYDKNKNYRIIVACENKDVYLLDKYSNKIEGWIFKQTQTKVNQIAQHFVNNEKDYIIFSDTKKTYILNRRGEVRIKPQYDFERNKNSKFYFEQGKSKKDARFVCTDTKGIAHFIFIEDGNIKKMIFDDFSKEHKFAYIDLLGNGAKYFVYTDNKKLKVFNRDKSLRFEQTFNSNIKNSLALYKLGKTGIQYIGITESLKNKIYLFNPNGKLLKGFPMNGCSPFTITSTNKKNKELNIIVGSLNKNLYNYSFYKK